MKAKLQEYKQSYSSQDETENGSNSSSSSGTVIKIYLANSECELSTNCRRNNSSAVKEANITSSDKG